LMELLGPHKFQDSFAKEILRFNRGGIVRNIPDLYLVFLATPVRMVGSFLR
jgi:hypothetical protein